MGVLYLLWVDSTTNCFWIGSFGFQLQATVPPRHLDLRALSMEWSYEAQLWWTFEGQWPFELGVQLMCRVTIFQTCLFINLKFIKENFIVSSYDSTHIQHSYLPECLCSRHFLILKTQYVECLPYCHKGLSNGSDSW